MAESKRISDLTPAEGITANDLLFLSSFVDQDNYTSRSAGLGLMALAMLSEFTFDNKLETVSKNIVGAINEVLNQLNEVEVYNFSPSNATGTLWCRRNGKVVYVYGSLTGLTSTATSVNLGTLKFKSDLNYGVLSAVTTTGAYTPIGTVWIDVDGKATLYKPSGTTGCYIFGAFICK